MNRLYAIETDLTVTGAKADHRLPLRPSQIEPFARALAAKLGVPGAKSTSLEDTPAIWVDEIAKDLKERKAGSTLVIAGEGQPPAVHAIVHAINHKLGNVNHTVVYTEPLLPGRIANSMGALDALYTAIDKGEVHTLLILGGNPAYTAPADLKLDELLAKQLKNRPRNEWLVVHLAPHFDETARLCHWHIPEAHFLESWSDGIAYDGTASIVQPLIAPLYAGKTAHEIIASLTRRKTTGIEPGSDFDDRTPHELVRDYWRTHRPTATAKLEFERFWQQALHDGVIAGTPPSRRSPSLPATCSASPR